MKGVLYFPSNKARPVGAETPGPASDLERLCERHPMAGESVHTNIVRIQLGGRNGSPIRGFATVDDADAELSEINWSMTIKRSRGRGYAVRRIADVGMEYLHRAVLARVLGRPLQRGEICDHINGNTLDNRRTNLRVTDIFGNNQNLSLRTNNTSGTRGVSWHAEKQRWRARVWHRGREHTQYFCDIADAETAVTSIRKRLGLLDGNANG